MAEDDFFQKFGLEVATGEVVIGQTYPIYGMVTKIIDENLDNVTIEVNHSIILRCSIHEQDKVDLLKSRAFEPGIFVTEITGIEPVTGFCATVIFGRSQFQNQNPT